MTWTPTEETSPGHRSPLALARTRRRMAVMIAFALIYAVALLVVALRAADRGFFVYQGGTVVVVDPDSAAARAGLRVGDRITAIDGHATDDVFTRSARVAAISPGQAVTLTVARASGAGMVTFTAPRRLPLASAAGVVLALVMLALALVADRGRGHDLPQQFLRSTVIYVVFLAGAFALDVTVAHLPLAVPWMFAMCLAAPATCHFMLRFPAGRKTLTRAETAAIYGPPIALATVLAINHALFSLAIDLPARRVITTWGGGVAGAMAPTYLLIGAIARGRRLRAQRAHIDAVAAGWLHLGGVVMVAPLIVGVIAAVRGADAFLAGGFRPYVAVAMVGGSACVVLAMTRVPFGELDRLWRRSSGYLLATLLAAGLYLVVIGLLGGVATWIGGGVQTTLAATLTAAVVFGPLRVRVQRIVDDRFARDRSRARALLRQAAEAAVATLDEDVLTQGFVERVRQALSASGVALYVRGADGWRAATRSGPAELPAVPDDDGQVALDATVAARAACELPGGATAVPVPVAGRAPVVVVVVPRGDGRLDDEPRELLSTAAASLAIALANARAHAELRELTERLRREVEVAERRRKEIARLKERLEEENRALIGELAARTGKAPVIGAGLAATFELVAKVARADATVLVRGETGVGKELIARAIHAASPRRSGPFVVVDCGAIAAGLVESALFGHAKGAFTGAVRAAAGAFRAAHGGTVFLDELGELPLELQPKLLRVLQEREVQPLGADGPVAIDVRVVCGTNRELEHEVAAGRFREDLLYRLKVVEIAVPPLRARKADVPALADHFLARLAARTGAAPKRLAPDALALMLDHDWPGNVRELEHAIEAAAVYGEGDELVARDLPIAGKVFRRRAEHALDSAAVVSDGAPRAGLRETLEDLERGRLAEVLSSCAGNRSRAAKALGMSRGALLRRLKRYNLAEGEGADHPA
ncbi:MAG: sigma 54-interacting transcriptional regulator [Myxococcales bacterium]|nr:sigma 54-interacting transcriptional regulator [Myxococcales bacterium]